MNRLQALYHDAEKNNVATLCCPLGGFKSIIVQDGGSFAIGLNSELLTGETDETVCLAHELGHFHTGACYRLESPLQLREKAEYKADAWTVRRLLPPAKLRRALREGRTEPWEIAEYFDLPEELVLRAAYIYRCKQIL